MGLGIGTVVAAFTMGKGIALVGNAMDRRLEFVSVMSKASTKQGCYTR